MKKNTVPGPIPDEIQPLFEKLINGDNPIEQIQAAYELGDYSKKDLAKQALLRGLVVPDSEVKITILDILTQVDFFGSDLVDPICELLSDSDEEVRNHAAEVLGTTKEKSAVPCLIRSLQDPESNVRFNVMAALANIGDPQASKPLEDFFLTQKKSWEDRYNVIDAIGMIAHEGSLSVLLKALKDPHPKVRENAALSVGHFNLPEVNKKLIDLLDDSAPGVQAAAAYMLGSFKSNEAVDYLIELLHADLEDLIIVACEALAKIQNPKTIPALIELLCNPTKQISIAAQQALDVFHNQTLIDPFVESMMNDPKILFLIHRLEKYGDQKISNEIVSKYQLPMWVEMLLNEVQIVKNQNKDD